jgi:GTP-binding protein
VKFLLSETDPARLEPCHAEVAFVGRSNVGKSTLLNALCRKDLARVSSTPGRTRTINVFPAAPGRWLIDLPGYGFAALSPKEKADWQAMIEGYLTGRPSLRKIFLLIDSKVGATKLDEQMLRWLQSNGLPWRIVATKADRIKKAAFETQKAAVARSLSISPEHVALVSAEKGLGVGALRQEVCGLLADQKS